MIPITKIDRHFFHKKMSAGGEGRGYDDLYYYDGDHDGRPCSLIRNVCRWSLMLITTVMMAITTIAKFIRNACRWGLMLITAVLIAITTIA
jgi:hypothetical protein